MIGKFNLYDFLAVLVPGLVTLWCAQQLLGARGIDLPVGLHGDLAEASKLIVVGFVIGLFLQRIAERCTEPILKLLWKDFPGGRWLLPENTEYPLKSRVISLATKHFGLDEYDSVVTSEELGVWRKRRNEEIFYLCYAYVDQHRLSERPLIFNAQFGMFRSFLTAFVIILLLSCSLLWRFWVYDFSSNLVSFVCTVSLFPLMWLAYAGCKKRGENFARSIYDLFLTSDLATGKH